MKFLWASYRKGGLGDIGEHLAPDITVQEFPAAIEEIARVAFDFSWVMIAGERRIPVGVVFGINCGTMVYIGETTWFPWATKRNKLESSVNFINEIRKTTNAFWSSSAHDKPYSEYILKHGIARRVGTFHLEGESLAEYQVRRWVKS